MDTPSPLINHATGQPFCTTEYIATDRWLRTTWQGFVSLSEAERGALAILEPLSIDHVSYLLNDNSRIQGPWFDSINWLQEVWAPQAQRLGLRYVAHVVQPHTESDLSTILTHDPFAGQFELQVFSDALAAEAWLRDCQRRDELPTGAAPTQPTAQPAKAA